MALLAGPNGAGKTTLMKVILGLVRPDSGSFEVDGAPVSIDKAWKRRIGYLPEAVTFSDNLSGLQLLRFFARARGVDSKRVDAVLGEVGLGRVRRRAVRSYSRGMRQRLGLGLGVAILAKPELLVLDEPTAGLDQEGLTLLWRVLAEWKEAGRLVLMSTHDLALSERRVDTIHVLREGRVLVKGSAGELRRKAGSTHRVWLDLVDSEAEARRLHDAIRNWGKGSMSLDRGQLRVEVSADELLELMRIQGDFPKAVCGLRVEEPTLDMVYEELLGGEQR